MFILFSVFGIVLFLVSYFFVSIKFFFVRFLSVLITISNILDPERLDPSLSLSTSSDSLRSKRFFGAKSEEGTGLSAFCPREKWGESNIHI